MKTIKKIFNKYCTQINTNYCEYIIKNKEGFIEAIELNATEREQKYKELWGAQKEYINETKYFCRHLLKPCNERDTNWLIRKNLFDDDLNLSALKISRLESELNLNTK